MPQKNLLGGANQEHAVSNFKNRFKSHETSNQKIDCIIRKK